MESLNNFADYLWVITKILLMLIFIVAVLRTLIGTIFGSFRRKIEETDDEKEYFH